MMDWVIKESKLKDPPASPNGKPSIVGYDVVGTDEAANKEIMLKCRDLTHATSLLEGLQDCVASLIMG